jgi:folate-binding protein YgfZ
MTEVTPSALDAEVDLAQHEALRSGCGARRLERDVLSVRGTDAVGYLQGQCSQDVAVLPVGGGAASLVLEPDGKLCALVGVARTAEDAFVVATDRGYGEPLTARLLRFRLRAKVEVEPLDWTCLALRGAGAPGVEAVAPLAAVPFAIGGWHGVDLLGPPESLESAVGSAVTGNVVWCDQPAWEACRVEAGEPVMGRELDAKTIAPEAGLVEWAVSLTKGCYTGQELIARLDARGNRVPRRLCGLVPVAGDAEAAPSALDGAALWLDDTEVGQVTSVARSPSLGPVALGYVRRAVDLGAVVEARGASGERVAVEVRALPLVTE